MLPNLYSPGAQNSATTTLAFTLAQHPEVYEGRKKEPHIFSRDDLFERGLDAIEREFYSEHRSERWVMDGSQSYLPLADALPRIDAACSDPRFIFVLRHPVDRARSAFDHTRLNDGSERRAFSEIVPDGVARMSLDELIAWEKKAVERAVAKGTITPQNASWAPHGFPHRYFWVGCYAEHIARYAGLFHRDSMLFLTFEEVVDEPARAYDKIGRFLDVDPRGFHGAGSMKRSETRKKGPAFALARRVSRRLSRVVPARIAESAKKRIEGLLSDATDARYSPADERALRRLYLEEIEKTEAITGLDLAAWKAT